MVRYNTKTRFSHNVKFAIQKMIVYSFGPPFCPRSRPLFKQSARQGWFSLKELHIRVRARDLFSQRELHVECALEWYSQRQPEKSVISHPQSEGSAFKLQYLERKPHQTQLAFKRVLYLGQIGNLELLIFVEGEKPKQNGEKPSEQGENQQTKPTYGEACALTTSPTLLPSVRQRCFNYRKLICF